MYKGQHFFYSQCPLRWRSCISSAFGSLVLSCTMFSIVAVILTAISVWVLFKRLLGHDVVQQLSSPAAFFWFLYCPRKIPNILVVLYSNDIPVSRDLDVSNLIPIFLWAPFQPLKYSQTHDNKVFFKSRFTVSREALWSIPSSFPIGEL